MATRRAASTTLRSIPLITMMRAVHFSAASCESRVRPSTTGICRSIMMWVGCQLRTCSRNLSGVETARIS